MLTALQHPGVRGTEGTHYRSHFSQNAPGLSWEGGNDGGSKHQWETAHHRVSKLFLAPGLFTSLTGRIIALVMLFQEAG